MATTERPGERPATEIVILGAGYAGLLFTTRIAGKTRPKDVRITLINDSPYFTERLRMHQFAANQAITWRPLARTLAKTHVTLVEGTATAIDTDRRTVTVATARQDRNIHYDYLVYALGSLTDRSQVPGVAEYAYTLAPRGPLSAATLRETLPALQANGGRVIVCGGGPTGIETAAELASRYSRLAIELVTEGRLGDFLGHDIGQYMRRRLTRLGVAIRDETSIAAVQADGVTTADGEIIPSDVCVWTGGFVAPTLAREAGLVVNERNQVVIDPFMRALAHPEIYAIGDAASPQEDPGVPVRMAAATAVILGAHGADCLSAVLHGRMPRPLSFAYLGQAVALGQGDAIGFANYPDDTPRRPYFSGQLAFQTREFFVRYLASASHIERRFPGSFYWPGKRRYTQAKARSQALVAAAQDRSLDPTPLR